MNRKQNSYNEFFHIYFILKKILFFIINEKSRIHSVLNYALKIRQKIE